jgi:putative transcriptional regulator
MMRVRLKADGRVVEILADGSEGPLPLALQEQRQAVAAPPLVPDARPEPNCRGAPEAGREASAGDMASHARRIRAKVRLTQTEFAARIGVPVETVRNWEQGKRVPRGPARALLKLIEHAPDVAFSVLRQQETAHS